MVEVFSFVKKEEGDSLTYQVTSLNIPPTGEVRGIFKGAMKEMIEKAGDAENIHINFARVLLEDDIRRCLEIASKEVAKEFSQIIFNAERSLEVSIPRANDIFIQALDKLSASTNAPVQIVAPIKPAHRVFQNKPPHDGVEGRVHKITAINIPTEGDVKEIFKKEIERILEADEERPKDKVIFFDFSSLKLEEKYRNILKDVMDEKAEEFKMREFLCTLPEVLKILECDPPYTEEGERMYNITAVNVPSEGDAKQILEIEIRKLIQQDTERAKDQPITIDFSDSTLENKEREVLEKAMGEVGEGFGSGDFLVTYPASSGKVDPLRFERGTFSPMRNKGKEQDKDKDKDPGIER